MLALVLTLLALAGGSIATFFIMDGPRRRAMELRRRLEEERELVRQDRWDNEDRATRLAAQVSELRDARGSLDRRMAEFDRRAITYEDLAAENRLIKADLKNMVLLVAQSEQQAFEAARSRTTLTQQRDLLAHAYLEEARAATRKALTATNYPASKRRLEEAIRQLESAGVRPTEAGQRQMMEELHQLYETAVRAAVEREKQAQIREQIREEARAERERQAAIEQAERDRRAIEKALNDALCDVTGRHTAEIELLRKQLAEAEAKAIRTISLAQITKSGYVYVISNLGSFGQDVFKIGMTRRLEPMDRVYELGDASVPFPFDVHMMIACDDAPALERALHKAFHKKRLNKVNPRKEFFRVTFEEILQVVREHHGEATYKADAEALEYLQSQSMTEEEMKEVQEVFEDVEEMAGTAAEDDN